MTANTLTLNDGGVIVIDKICYLSPVIMEEFRWQFTISTIGADVIAQYKNDDSGKADAEAERQAILDLL